MSATTDPTPSRPPPAPRRQAYVRAVGPRLRILLYIVFGLVAVLVANSLYMASITVLESLAARFDWAQKTWQTPFYLYQILVHVALGLLLIVPFVAFGVTHLWVARNRKNRRAIRIGYALFIVSLVVLGTGLALVRIEGFIELKNRVARDAVYWAHVACPLVAGWLYWLHRLAGPRIKWRLGFSYLAVTGAIILGMISLHSVDPRAKTLAVPETYLKPSEARIANEKFLSAQTLMADQYCLKCHADAYKGWFHSAHHFSSFNNPAYLASVLETREVALKRDGNVQASRWCAGCHDPVPFFTGAFDDPKFDVVKHPTAQAGITCTTCHAITSISDDGPNIGNADFTIEEPQHYPFAFNTHPVLQFINNQLVKAKPAFHKQTFLKPFHRSADFCATCHKVHLPKALNHYKDFLRGQNHYDTYLLSGVSGHGARSFYYPPVAKTRCAECHMPLAASTDFGAQQFFDAAKNETAADLSIHSHQFPAANTAIAYFVDDEEVIKAHQDFMKGVVRVDLFGVKEDASIEGKLHAPLRPEVPTLEPGKKYLLETVIRTLKMGHPFTQGTADSNEVWLDVTVTSGDRVIGRSGGIDERGETDRWSHFVNLFMLDRNGNRINRRNPQDIFVPLYNHQIPPGAGQTVHFEMELPSDLSAPVTVEIKLQYRKFDQEYMDFVVKSRKDDHNPIRGYTPGEPFVNPLPITTLAVDQVTFPVAGVEAVAQNEECKIPPWERWNDYGIGLFLSRQPGLQGELKQAVAAFTEVEKLGRFDGPLNLARVYNAEGQVDAATAALQRASAHTDPPAYPWTLAWLTGLLNRQQGYLAEAEQNFRTVLDMRTEEMIRRKFDFSQDYEVINELGVTLFERAKQAFGDDQTEERRMLLEDAAEQFDRTLAIDSENVTAHYQLSLIYTQLGDAEQSERHAKLHARYKLDDTAKNAAVTLARQKYPAANHAAEGVVIYPLRRPGAPGLPAEVAVGSASDATLGGGGP